MCPRIEKGAVLAYVLKSDPSFRNADYHGEEDVGVV